MKSLVLGTAFSCLVSVANARDFGQWETVNPEIREWYQALMQLTPIGRIRLKSRATNTLPSSPTPGPMNRYAENISTSEQELWFRTTS